MGGLLILNFELLINAAEYAAKKIEKIWDDLTGDIGDLMSGDMGFDEMAFKAFKTGSPIVRAITWVTGDPYDEAEPPASQEDFWDDEADFINTATEALLKFGETSENIWGDVTENIEHGKIDAFVTPEDIQKPFDDIGEGMKTMLTSLMDELSGWLGMGEFDALGGFGDEEEDGGSLLDEILSDEDIEEKKTKFQEFMEGVKTSWGEGMAIMAQEFEGFATRFGDGMADALSTAIVEGESMKEAFKGFMKSMTQEVLKMILKTLILRTVMSALGLPVGQMNLASGLDSLAGVTDVGDVAFGPAQGRFIVGPEGAFSLSPRDSIVAGTNLFGGGQGGGSHMTVDGYIDGSGIMLSNQRETNTTNRLS